MIRVNFWSGLSLVAFSVLLLTWVIPNYGGGGFSFGLPPQLVATIGAWIMLVSALTLVVVSTLELIKSDDHFFISPDFVSLWHQLWPFVYVLFFIGLASFLPLTWIAPFMIAGLLWILGERRWLVFSICALTPPLGLYILTVYMMKIGVV